MSESKHPTSPTNNGLAANPVEPSVDSVSPDPLLQSGSFIDPDRTDTGAESPESHQNEPNPDVVFEPGTVIAAQPISVVPPGESWGGAPKTPVRKNPEDMAKRPSWLPEDWRMELKVRSSGSTAGTIDRYYYEPTGQRRFRSKNEVVHFLETGTKRKKNSTSEADVPGTPGSEKPKKSSKSPGNEKPKKSSGKRKKTDA